MWRLHYKEQHKTCPDDNDTWLLREPDGIVLDRYTLPAAESANIDGRLSTLAVVLRDVAAVDPVMCDCALRDDWSNIDAVEMAVVAAVDILLYSVEFAIDALAVNTRLSSS